MKTILSAVIGAMLALSAVEAGAQAKAAERKIDLVIEQQSLADALNDWAKQTGLQLVSPSSEMMNTQLAPRIKGAYTPQRALEELLKGTALTYEWVSDRAVAIREKSPVVPAALQTSGARERVDGSRLQLANLAAQDERSRGAGEARAQGGGSGGPETEAKLEELEEIVVTGTHIQGLQNRTAPVVTIDREAIERTGYSSTQELIRSIPQNFAGGQNGASDDGGFGIASRSGTNITSANGVNLRGLGNSSTLVLLNGHRMAPSAYGSVVDISLIPLAAIERVELLTHGASALYGSDAVGGVVNIITRSDYEGADTSVRYGSAEDSARSERDISQILGAKWTSGNVVASAQYQSQDVLRSVDRDFTAALPPPTDILPETETFGIAINGRQDISQGLRLYGDALFSKREVKRSSNEFDFLRHSVADSKGLSAAGGIQYGISEAWSLNVGLQYSDQRADYRQRFVDDRATDDVRFKDQAVDAVLNGKVLATQAGPVSVALGGTYRKQDLDQDSLLQGGGMIDREVMRRDVSSGFAELYIPIVGASNELPLAKSLALSAALRYDDYSDFGSTTNPRVGVQWSPTSQLGLRASYSESFRAPNGGELLTVGNRLLFIFPVADPAGGQDPIPALVQVGSKDDIGPERARMIEFGVDYTPEFAPGLTLNADYYRIRYIDRIVLLSFEANALSRPEVYGSLISPIGSDADAQAFIDTAIADGFQYFDLFGTGATNVRNVIDIRQQNAAHVEQSGIDVRAAYRTAFQSGAFSTSITASHINEIDTAFARGAVAADFVEIGRAHV